MCNYAVRQGYNPYASHVFFPTFLHEENPEDRTLGIRLGLAWGQQAEEVWFCKRQYNKGMRDPRLVYGPPLTKNYVEESSPGMLAAYQYWKNEGTKKFRYMLFTPSAEFVAEIKQGIESF